MKTKTFTEKDNIQSAVLIVKNGAESLRKVAHTTGISHTTLAKWVPTSNFQLWI